MVDQSLTALVHRHLLLVTRHILSQGKAPVHEIAARINALSAGVALVHPAQVYPAMAQLVAAEMAVPLANGQGYQLTSAGYTVAASETATWTRIAQSLTAAAQARQQHVTNLVSARLAGLLDATTSSVLFTQVTGDLVATAMSRCVSGAPIPVAVNDAIAAFGDLVCLRAVSDLSSSVASETAPLTMDHFDLTVAEDDQPAHQANYDLRGIATIQLDFPRALVRIVPTEGMTLGVREYDNAAALPSVQTQMGDVIRLVQGETPSSVQARIVIGVPANFKGQLLVQSQQGDVQILNLRRLTQLVLDVQQGNANLTYLAAKALTVTLANGDLTLQGSQLGTVKLTGEQANVLVTQSVMTALDLAVKTGDVVLRKLGVTGEANVTAMQGDIQLVAVTALTLNGQAPAGQISANWTTMTGDVALTARDGMLLTAPQTADIAFDFDATAGQVTVPETAKLASATPHRQQGCFGTQSVHRLTGIVLAGDVVLRDATAE